MIKFHFSHFTTHHSSAAWRERLIYPEWRFRSAAAPSLMLMASEPHDTHPVTRAWWRSTPEPDAVIFHSCDGRCSHVALNEFTSIRHEYVDSRHNTRDSCSKAAQHIGHRSEARPSISGTWRTEPPTAAMPRLRPGAHGTSRTSTDPPTTTRTCRQTRGGTAGRHRRWPTSPSAGANSIVECNESSAM